MTNKYDNVYINDSYSIAGMYESDGPLKKYFDRLYEIIYIHIPLMRMICILEKKVLKRQKLKCLEIVYHVYLKCQRRKIKILI